MSEAKSIPFVKMHGTGNDFVLIDARNKLPFSMQEFAIKSSMPKFGVGADGVIFLKASTNADFCMAYYNADGTETTCGNGIRCLARFIKKLNLLSELQDSFFIQTMGGVVQVWLHSDNKSVKIDMGKPIFEGSKIPTSESGEHLGVELNFSDESYKIYAIGMGNPHCVIFVQEIDTLNISELGTKMEKHWFFPERTNAEFVQVIDRNRLKMRVWERGVGETLSCGTGACAAVVAGVKSGKVDPITHVQTLGGELMVEWNQDDGKVYLTGPTEEVFEGIISYEQLLK
jgi:diaminopimelate epimerase